MKDDLGRRPTVPPPPGARMLMYHSISPATGADPHALRVHPETFERHLTHLRRRGMRGVSMTEWLAAARGGDAGGLVALTFDDGYRDFVEHAMPIMARHGMTGTVYVVAGKIDGSSDWVVGGPDAPLMTADDIRGAAAAGHEVASHTTTHARLDHLGGCELRAEVAESRAILEDVVGRPVTGFAYPYGAFDEAAVAAVREAGYGYAAATDDHTRRDGFSIARIFVSDRDTPLRLEAKLLRHKVRGRTRAAEGAHGPLMRSVLAADRLRRTVAGEVRERIPYAPERPSAAGPEADVLS